MSPAKISKEEYYLNIAREVALKSTCFRAQIGTIIVKDDQIIATGYIGAPRKTKDWFEHDNCLRTEMKLPHGQRYEICRSVHSEQNAIINAARAGVDLLGGDMYSYGMDPAAKKPFDLSPCFICKKMIINAGIERVIMMQKNNEPKIFYVEDWIKDWQEHDIIDDKIQYGNGRKILSKEEIEEGMKKNNW